MGFFDRLSGLDNIAEAFPAESEPIPADVLLKKQTVKIGAVRYRNCVTVGVTPTGLFLGVRPPFGRKAELHIPWKEIKPIRETRLYGSRGVQLSVGTPEAGNVTVYIDLFETMRTYLPGT